MTSADLVNYLLTSEKIDTIMHFAAQVRLLPFLAKPHSIGIICEEHANNIVVLMYSFTYPSPSAVGVLDRHITYARG